jgi:hypothetical protein
MSCTWITISIYYNKLQKKNPKFIHMKKVFFGEKDMQSFFINNNVGDCIPFAPNMD